MESKNKNFSPFIKCLETSDMHKSIVFTSQFYTYCRTVQHYVNYFPTNTLSNNTFDNLVQIYFNMRNVTIICEVIW